MSDYADLKARLSIKADMIQLGEKIEWGSDSAIMREAAAAIDALERERVKPDRETFDAMCAMRDSINEHIPMPSLESDLLQGPENSVFCATVAEAVIAEVLRLRSSKVRQLEWHNFDGRGAKAQAWKKANYLITYWKSREAFEVVESYPGYQGDAIGDGFYPTLESAKAAAQADYEARILAALAAMEGKRLIEESERWKRAFAAQSNKLQKVLHIPGVRAALQEDKSHE